MIKALEHRGPDGSRAWFDDRCGLIHAALHTSPESLHEVLPHKQQGGSGLVITADARLDNRAELIGRLRPRTGATPITDAELILAAFVRWGDNCVDHLLGDFAFAVWDPRAKGLFCARDHLGARPFYYFCSDTRFVFGSEIKAVLTREEVPRRLNDARVADYLSERFSSKEDTFYKDVRRLPSGCRMYVDVEAIQVERYWDFDPHREVRLGSDSEYAEAFHDLLKEAVRSRLRTVGPPGAHLSGGLDSSSVAVLAREILQEERRDPLHTFTARFSSLPSCDESSYADSILAQGGFEPHFVDPCDENLLDDLDEMLSFQDEPIYWPSWVLERSLFRAARDAGVRTLLTGVSGDITLSHGAGYFHELFRHGRWIRLLQEVDAYCRLRSLDSRTFLWKDAIRPAISHAVPSGVRRLLWQWKFDGTQINPLIHPDLDRRTHFTERARAEALERFARRRTQRGHHYSMMDDDWIARSLETGDTFSVLYGMRSAHPFFDKRLMEFGLALPSDQKLQQGLSRVVLRRAMNGKLSELVARRRTKVGLVPLVAKSLLHQNRSMLKHFEENDLDALDGLVNVNHVRRLLHRQASKDGYRDGSSLLDDWPDLWAILSCVMLSRWMGLSRVHNHQSTYH